MRSFLAPASQRLGSSPPNRRQASGQPQEAPSRIPENGRTRSCEMYPTRSASKPTGPVSRIEPPRAAPNAPLWWPDASTVVEINGEGCQNKSSAVGHRQPAVWQPRRSGNPVTWHFGTTLQPDRSRPTRIAVEHSTCSVRLRPGKRRNALSTPLINGHGRRTTMTRNGQVPKADRDRRGACHLVRRQSDSAQSLSRFDFVSFGDRSAKKL